MSNLATMIMEGASYGTAKLNHHYDHENGAGMIAMESAEALRDIYESIFYVPNSCEIQAALEGATCVEESSQASVMEASIKGAWEKIKQFFINLRDKVKDFLHNIKRYLTGIFGNDRKWVETYADDLKAIRNDLKGYKISMFKYSFDKYLNDGKLSSLFDNVNKVAEGSIDAALNNNYDTKVSKVSELDEGFIKDEFEKEYKKAVMTILGKDANEDEYDDILWSNMRSGAKGQSDTDDVEVSSFFDDAITALKSSNDVISNIDSAIKNADRNYGKILDGIKSAENSFNKLEKNSDGMIERKNGAVTYKYNSAGASNVTNTYHALSAIVTKIQSLENKKNNAVKTAVVERNAAYKKALTGAFAYARKNKGGK